MADNYIEKRMEELHSGRATRRPSATPSLRPLNLRRKLILDFPPQRVLILTGPDTTLSHPIAKAFRATDSKTALYTLPKAPSHNQSPTYSPTNLNHQSIATTSQLAQQIGLRHTLILNQTDLTEKLQSLLKAWRDLDIVLLLPSALQYLPILQQIWTAHKIQYPIPSAYQPRLLLITQPTPTPDTNPSDPTPTPTISITPPTASNSTPTTSDSTSTLTHPYGTQREQSSNPNHTPIKTTEIQLPTDHTPDQIKSLTSTILYLSLPESNHLTTSPLRIQ